MRNVLRSSRPLVLSALMLVFAGCATAPVAPKVPGFIDAKLVILVRHGDIDVEAKRAQGKAVPLLPRGQQRAGELAAALRSAGISRVVATETLRTQQTGAPTAELFHVREELPFGHGTEPGEVKPVSYAERARREGQRVVDYLAETSKPGDVVLLVHHHSVIPSILAALGQPDEPAIAEQSEFDRAYVIVPDAATHTYRILRLRYGGDWGAAQAPAEAR